MKQYLKIFLGIFLALAASRLIPHPPNFTSLIALSFYIPVIFGIKFIPALIISFAITDLIIGYHLGTHWTWGSILVIGIISKFFTKNYLWRMSGALLGASIFFIVTNFGVYLSGMYGYSFKGFIECYTLAIPFFTYSVISTIIFSVIIEIIYSLLKVKLKFLKS